MSGVAVVCSFQVPPSTHILSHNRKRILSSRLERVKETKFKSRGLPTRMSSQPCAPMMILNVAWFGTRRRAVWILGLSVFISLWEMSRAITVPHLLNTLTKRHVNRSNTALQARGGGGLFQTTKKDTSITLENDPDVDDVLINNLQMGYSLLDGCFGATSKLWMLKGVKWMLFHLKSVDEIREIWDASTEMARRRHKELKLMRNMSPDVSGKFLDANPVSHAMNDVIKDKMMTELMDPTGRFDLNFALSQLQACRMIVATCRGLKPFDPNPHRAQWLEETAVEYETFRKTIIDVIELYIEGKGSYQPTELERKQRAS